MKSQYGAKLRILLKNSTLIHTLIDLWWWQFESASVDTNILIFSKELPTNQVKIQSWNYIPFQDLNLTPILQSDLDLNAFSLVNKNIIDLKIKIEGKGVLLERWDEIKINYWILTWRNDVKINWIKEWVFIIDEVKRRELIHIDPNSEKLIKPILRWRDIFKYGFNYQKKYLIAVNYWMHKEIDKFPWIRNHLMKYEFTLKDRAQVKRWDHHWMELDQNPSDKYMSELQNTKIIYPNIWSDFTVAFEDEWYVINQKCFFISWKDIKYLMAILNSKLNFFYFKLIWASLGDSWYEMSKIFVNKLPIIQLHVEGQKVFIDLVDQILEITKKEDYLEREDLQKQVKVLESRIDDMVYKLYELTPEEIELVEESLK